MQYKAVLIGSIKRGERRERTEKIQKAAERSFAGVCASGLARNPAPARLWIFVRFVHFVRRVLGSAERSDADLYQDKHTPCSQCSYEDLFMWTELDLTLSIMTLEIFSEL